MPSVIWCAGLHDESGACRRDPSSVLELVGEQRHHDERHAGRQRGEGGPRAAMAHHQLGMVEHPRLVDPGLHVDVGRDRSQCRGVEATAHGQQHPCAQSLDRAQRHRVGLGGDRHVTQDRAEGQVDQRRVRPTPPVRQRGGSFARLVKPNGVREGRRVERRRESRQIGLSSQLGDQALAVLLQRGGGHGDRAGLDLGQRDRHLGDRRPRPGREHRRGVLGRVAQHQLGTPVVPCILHPRQHRVGRQPTEQLAVAQHRRFGRRDDRQPLPDRRDLLLGRLATGPEREAG